jgi:hypothetical protein
MKIQRVGSHPSGEKHWHGAAGTTAMMRIAIRGALDGRAVEWMEKVSVARYGVVPGAS